jgi:hypothetical protein
MLISGISIEDLEAAREVASQDLGNELIFTEFESLSPTRHKVRLQVRDIDGPGARRHSMMFFIGAAKAPRRSRYACAHAWGFLFVAIYERNPHAYIRTADITYHNAWEFLATYETVLNRNVGSQACPIYFADECTCPSDTIPTDTIEGWSLGIAEVPSPENMGRPQGVGLEEDPARDTEGQ